MRCGPSAGLASAQLCLRSPSTLMRSAEQKSAAESCPQKTLGWQDHLWWQGQDRKTLRRISTLIKDIVRNAPWAGQKTCGPPVREPNANL